jgi:DNA mismatch endonuclease (patch repair protein)
MGRPDIMFASARIAVFVDGRFWHGHPRFFTPGKSGRYWDSKIRKNQARDKIVNRTLRAQGWRVLRYWDFQVEADSGRVAGHVADAVAERKAEYSLPANRGKTTGSNRVQRALRGKMSARRRRTEVGE